MKKSDILDLVAKATEREKTEIVQKERPGRQIKANALFEGSSSPASPRTPVGIFFATDSPDLAVEGAKRRLSLDLPFPEAIVVVSASKREAKVFAYADSDLGVVVARSLNGTLEAVPRPAFAREAKPAGTLSSQRLQDALRSSPNVILQGPPGTGKSSIALELVRTLAASADGLTSDRCRFSTIVSEYPSASAMVGDTAGLGLTAPVVWEMVQLHAGYGYEDLVRRVAPVSKDGDLQFEVQDRLFPKLCELAAARGDKLPVILILDEINRCNLAATLGECIFAIDPGHRGTPIRMQYQGPGMAPSLSVPPNLWIIGTMNTADRSIAMVDYAIRRRFRFLDVPADEHAIDAWYASRPNQATFATRLFVAANKGLRPGLMVSHSVFMIPSLPAETWPMRMARQVARHVAPLLIEYTREGHRAPGPLICGDTEFNLDQSAHSTSELEADLVKWLEHEPS